MSVQDAIARVSAIQAQITSLTTAFSPPSPTAATTTGGPTAGPAPSPTGSSSFASQLATATATGAVGAAADVNPTGAVALPAGAASQLTSAQQTFASRLASDTGLDPGVVSAWLLAEESGGAATSRQAQNNNDWLNIGYTDSATYGATDSVWSDPTTAADATAGWLKGQSTIPGYGTASSGIQAILATAGQSPSAQIAALQGSGWASGGYPDLPSLYTQLTGA
jgi:hypothetical protein